MSTRRSSSSAGSAAAASASAASAAPTPVRARSTQSSGAAAASTISNSHARVIAPATPASAATSLSGHKRPAAASAGSSSSAAAASASSATPSSDQPASSASQAKRQRGESSSRQSNGLSAAAPAFSAGVDPLPTPSRRSAASSAASSSAAAQLSSNQIQRSNAKASAGSASPIGASAASLAPPAPVPHHLFSEAKELLSGALPFAQRRLSGDSDKSSAAYDKGLLADARMSIAGRASANTMVQLTRLCLRLLWDSCSLELPSEQTALRGWILRVDALFTQLATELPRLKLSREDCYELVGRFAYAGALQAVPALVRRVGSIPTSRIGKSPQLTWSCITPREHVASLQPYLRLFEYGLDPTEIVDGGDPLSALQLARNFVRDHPLSSAPTVSGPLASMHTAAVQSDRESRSLPSLLLARAVQQHEPTQAAETQRHNGLHAQFMHALIPAWLAHSTKVRALLLQAAPTRLIPPLVDIVSRYLDLEGVAPERSAPEEDPEEMD